MLLRALAHRDSGTSIRLNEEGFMKNISIAGDLLFPSTEEILWLVERYDIVIEEICEANANPPACHIYFKQDRRIMKRVRFLELGWEREEPVAPNIAVFISSETEKETVERIEAAVERRGMRVVKTDFPEMGTGCRDRLGSFGPPGRPSRSVKAPGRAGPREHEAREVRIRRTASAARVDK